MHKSATKCNKTVGKWCKNKHGASKIIDTLETYQLPWSPFTSRPPDKETDETGDLDYVVFVRRDAGGFCNFYMVSEESRPSLRAWSANLKRRHGSTTSPCHPHTYTGPYMNAHDKFQDCYESFSVFQDHF
jgi:hypothetical protein